MTEKDRLFSPSEAARRLGVSPKALRIYERRGLVSPKRTAAGWRVYGPEELARVKEVLALKALGLGLGQIADLLGERRTDVRSSLDVQRAALLEQRDRIDRALALVEVARRRLASGEILGAEALAALLKDQPAPVRHWTARMQRYYDEHLEPSDWRALEAASASPWPGLLGELRDLAARRAAPGSDEPQRFFKRWIEASERASGGDAALRARMGKAWEAAMQDPDTAPTLPISAEELAYLRDLAVAYAAAAQALP